MAATGGEHFAMWADSLFMGFSNSDYLTGAKTSDWVLAGDTGVAGIQLIFRPNIVVMNGVNKDLIAWRNGPTAWNYATPQFSDYSYGWGCCDTSDGDGALAVDAANGWWYVTGVRVSLTTGTKVAQVAASYNAPQPQYYAVDGNIEYQALAGAIIRLNFGTLGSDWTASVGTAPTAQLGAPAFVSPTTDDIAVASPAGTLVLLKDSATQTTVWSKSFTAFASTPLRPITVTTGPTAAATSGMVLETTGDPALVAFDVGTGITVWTYSAPGRIDDVVVGQGGLVYAFVSSMGAVYALDVTTGKVAFAYTSIPSGTGPYGSGVGAELMLRAGRIYVWYADQVTSFPVPSTGYDPASPWAMRFHDNQHTSCKTSPMTY